MSRTAERWRGVRLSAFAFTLKAQGRLVFRFFYWSGKLSAAAPPAIGPEIGIIWRQHTLKTHRLTPYSTKSYQPPPWHPQAYLSCLETYGNRKRDTNARPAKSRSSSLPPLKWNRCKFRMGSGASKCGSFLTPSSVSKSQLSAFRTTCTGS
jgi:hypothetical protein